MLLARHTFANTRGAAAVVIGTLDLSVSPNLMLSQGTRQNNAAVHQGGSPVAAPWVGAVTRHW